VLTKADKPSAAELGRALAATRAAIAKRPAAHPEVHVTSAAKGAGLAELRAAIAALLAH
jgi:GTP-binding protein